VLSFSHTVDHENISTEFHTEEGPFTQVPLKGKRSSLVWVVNPGRAETLLALDDETLGQRIEEMMQSMLGKVTLDVRPQAWATVWSGSACFCRQAHCADRRSCSRVSANRCTGP
jgi:2-octaprenyl-6-methoxyphenol hydroxylase